MTVPLLRVCVHCGYPMPGSHASSCRDAGSVVAEIAYTDRAAPQSPTYPARLAQDYELDRVRAQVASLTADNERLRAQVDRDDKTIGDLGLEIERYRQEARDAAADNGRLIRERDSLARRCAVRFEETEKLRTELEYAQLGEQKYRSVCRDLQADLSSLRELESAARAWRLCVEVAERIGAFDLDEYERDLAAAVDALPPTPPATEGSDVQDR